MRPDGVNGARGEVGAVLGGVGVRLCVTLRALAALEMQFQVSGFEALGERLQRLGAADLLVVLEAVVMDGIDVRALDIGYGEAIAAVVAAFEAMSG